MNAPDEEHRRVTLTLDLNDDGLAYIHAADALLHLIGGSNTKASTSTPISTSAVEANLAATTRYPD